MSPDVPNEVTTGEVESLATEVVAYRAHFSCRNTGKVKARSKRKITWRFGLYAKGSSTREEHQVELTWSLKSGKTSLLWNNKDISHFFPSTQSHKNPPMVIDYNWQSSSGVTFVIEAHAFPREHGNQYEMLIDGRSFFDLPRPSQFVATTQHQPRRVTPDRRPAGNSPQRETSRVSEEEEEYEPQDVTQQGRLAAAGYGQEEDSVDALRSDLYSSSLDALRGEMSSTVPELEEMMSRAIIYAYSEDHDSIGSSIGGDSLSYQTEDELDATEVEADALCETFEWMKWTMVNEPEPDHHELVLEYMRNQVETMVAHARHERLSPHAASRIMICISAVLNLKLARKIPRDTLILTGMNRGVTTCDVHEALSSVGQIQAVCTAKGENGFAVCRFALESTATDACQIATDGGLLALGDNVQVFNVFAKEFPWCMNKKESEPRRDSRHHRQNVTIGGKHWIDPCQEDDSVELFKENNKSGEPRRRARRISTVRQNSHQDSLEFSTGTSRVSMSPASAKEMSTGTMSTLSTLDGEDFNLSGTSIFLTK